MRARLSATNIFLKQPQRISHVASAACAASGDRGDLICLSSDEARTIGPANSVGKNPMKAATATRSRQGSV